MTQIEFHAVAEDGFVFWRYRLEWRRFIRQVLDIPHGYLIASVQRRDGTPDEVDLWVLVDPDQPTEQVAFRFIGTGAERVARQGQTPMSYHGTVQLEGGTLVLHVCREISWPHS